VTLAGADVDGDSLSFKVTSLPADGKLYAGSGTGGHLIVSSDLPYGVSGRVTYDPNANYNGPDSFDFKAHDGTVDSAAAAAVSIAVAPVNDAPTAAASPASVSMNEDGAAESVSLSGSDVETADANLKFTVTAVPTHGTLKQAGTPVVAGDTFTG